MDIIGVDVSKGTLAGVRIDRSFKVKEDYSVKNTSEEIGEFLDKLKRRFPKVVVASESTAEYHFRICSLLYYIGVPFRLLNPI
jgi:transposase